MPVEPPSNGGFMVAAYIVTAVILVGYWVRLSMRAKSVSGKREEPKA